MLASVASCTIVSTTQSHQESGNITDISNIRYAGFDFNRLTTHCKQTHKIGAALCWLLHFYVWRSSEGNVHFYVKWPQFDLEGFVQGFLWVDCTLQTSRTNNKQDIGTFMLTCPSFFTLKEGSKVKFDITKRFPAYGFLKVDCALQTSRTNNRDFYPDPP